MQFETLLQNPSFIIADKRLSLQTRTYKRTFVDAYYLLLLGGKVNSEKRWVSLYEFGGGDY